MLYNIFNTKMGNNHLEKRKSFCVFREKVLSLQSVWGRQKAL